MASPPLIDFRPASEHDFPRLAAWLAEPHVRKFYQKLPVTAEEVALEYGPAVRNEEPTLCHLALSGQTPFAYLQCYRNADYPEWAELIGAHDGVSIDLYIGEPAFLHRGFGRAALGDYLRRIAFERFGSEQRAYISHEPANAAALKCSMALGFRPVRAFFENGVKMILLDMDRGAPA
ncbi:MAG TPA: GNAT family N-acetyltransferase [Rhizomicrobium sp.]|jgi:aminoglycoside 6'-N-acetyltransferase